MANNDNNESPKKIPRIVFTTTTPYKVLNLENYIGIRGEKLETREVMHLCRCGQSKKKPCCDGSHTATGIEGDKLPGRLKDKVHSFKGKEITIHDNRCVCSHDSSCMDLSPTVFIKGRRPWINPDGATKEEIIATIHECPSGALSYSLDGVLYDSLDREPTIKIAQDGPIEVKGGIILEDDMNSTPQSAEHYTLCRCGASKNKPFCDGSHFLVDFTDQN